MAQQASIPWPLTIETTRAELQLYLDTVHEPTTWGRPTRCEPWTVRDITRHLGATFQRFADMLEQSRTGDSSPPFAKEELDQQNLLAVDEFEGHPEERLSSESDRFLSLIGEGDEPMAHQSGTIPVALQLLYGLNDIVFHHDDVSHAFGYRYRPHPAVVELLVPVWDHSLRALGNGKDDWHRMLTVVGR
jgi:uncharacterized protein (TIGR03083 family)